ncbi:beta-1,4-mannosyltransferase [Exophiala aquamarina CBS 119918]|uniref:Chitobiosyldiphosphodolichol beta-mannosyltransferase n=1 Tax=Exophiala aquamarina CBS 119918 TaxID=1182545 RepID=A0A072PND0_9EURO|nr:beta-1,4-mannosyltransferase [Exophiala aquamarina CBS 119918]KEF60818.1 beta-1,4-mannosyltransferase [Exophiala aquamarina CBS 119918]
MILTVLLILSTLFTVLLLSLPSQCDPSDKSCSVQVLVLGDIGRSPRMQYHASSIAKHGGTVQLIGYPESDALPELVAHPNVSIVPILPPPKWLQTTNKLLFLIFGPLKVLIQTWFLWKVLGYSTKASKWLVVQNPPSIPTLFVVSLISLVRRTRLVVDWHNFGYSILALKLGSGHPLVALSKRYEKYFAKSATANFAVTDAMAQLLRTEFIKGSPVITLHDRPADMYRPLTESDRIQFLQRYQLLAKHFNDIADKKARLLVSSTSWTADEDFGLLLDALCNYSACATSSHPHLPELIVVITGKGPQKQQYLEKITSLQAGDALEMVDIYTDFLSFKDYALLLGSADLGISLHTSSSGVDLPMKVVDMFGAGLPVAGWSRFTAWPELVKEKVNGRGFGSSDELAEVLRELFDPASDQLLGLKKGAEQESQRRWASEWDPAAGKLFGLVD